MYSDVSDTPFFIYSSNILPVKPSKIEYLFILSSPSFRSPKKTRKTKKRRKRKKKKMTTRKKKRETTHPRRRSVDSCSSKKKQVND